MSLGAVRLKTKKALKERKGQTLSGYYVETVLPIFPNEYPEDGTGRVNMVGPDAYTDRRWYATIYLKDGIITKVE